MKKKIWKRCVVILSIVLLVGAISYTILNCVTVLADSSLKREIAREIEKIKEKGEPTTIEELIPEEVPDEENGALLYRRAFKLKEDLEKEYKEQWQYFPYESSKAWEEVPEEEKERVRNLLLYDSVFADFYGLLEKASNMKCQFVTREDYAKGVAMPLPHLSRVRSCCRLLAAKAKLEAESREIDKALNTCLTGLKLARSLSNEPLLISQLVRNASDQIALDSLKNVLGKGKASKGPYRALIGQIVEEREDKITYFALLGERTALVMQEFARLQKLTEMGEEERRKVFEELLGEEEAKSLEDVFLRSPETFLDNQELHYLRATAKRLSLIKEPYWQARQELEDFDKEFQELPKEKAILAQVLAPAFSRSYYQEARLDALLGGAEIVLACHIYKAEHGDYPFFLKELTPGIVPSLPLDPFTGKSYIFKKQHEGFTVYSVGKNLKDDGGISHKEKQWKGDYDIVWKCER